MLSQAFAKGCKGKLIKPLRKVNHLKTMEGISLGGVFPELENIATFGVLRGCDSAIKKSKEFWYIDHGYFGKGNYRITRNALLHNGEGNHDWNRFNKFNNKFSNWKRNGKCVVICAPSTPMSKFLNIENWLSNTIEKVKKYTDREIIISQKINSPKGYYPDIKNDIPNLPIDEALDKAWVLITDHSNTMVTSLIKGVPIICTNTNRKIGALDRVEKPIYNREWLKNLAYNQWSLEEIEKGKAWKELNMWG